MCSAIFGALLLVVLRAPGLEGMEHAGMALTATSQSTSDRVTSDADQAIRWLRDSWVTAQIELRLLTNRDVNVADVRVRTRDGVVTLDGTVPSMEARLAAQEDARRVDGVKSVINHLQVGSTAGAPPQGIPPAPSPPSSGSM